MSQIDNAQKKDDDSDTGKYQKRRQEPGESVLEYRVGCLEQLCEKLLLAVTDGNKKLSEMSERMTGGDGRLLRCEQDVKDCKSTNDRMLWGMISTCLTAIGALITALCKGH